MTIRNLLLPVLTLVCFASRAAAAEPPNCAASLQGLHRLVGDASFPLRWVETSMNDSKPMVVSILERDGSLFMEFLKTREGLWAEGTAVICIASTGLEARIGQLRLGPAAPWLLRGPFGHERTFVMSRQGGGVLRIGTPGWTGTFLPTRD
jgi:hypothetical protein